MLFCTDLVFFIIHINTVFSPDPKNTLLLVDSDESFPEMYQYIKWFWIIILLATLTLQRKSINYIGWLLVFSYILFDDALQIHENFGNRIAAHIDFIPPFGLRPQDIGELAVTATAGLGIFPLLLFAYYRGSAAFRRMSHDLLLLIIALFFFGVVIDMLHIAIHPGKLLNQFLAFFEDGGEMLVATATVWYVFLLCVRKELSTDYLTDFIPITIAKLRKKNAGRKPH